MGSIKELVILAVTKMHGGVCTAGIDVEGKWVRPIRLTAKRGRESETITDYCLLPVDFFHGGKSHLVNCGVSRVWLAEPVPSQPHIEDWTLDIHHRPQLLRKLDQQEQADFLARYCESDISILLPNQEHSLGLFLPDSFVFTFGMNQSGTDVTARAEFTIGHQGFSDVGCTDLRMRALGRRLLQRSSGTPCTLDQADFKRRGKEITYLALGLSRLYKGKHWLLVVGVHTIPELEVEIDYARL